MSAQLSLQPPPPAWEKEHLWLCLLALGFDPAGAVAAGKISTHLRLGVNMFDKPNKDAFHIIARFLFSKLDQSRCNEVFRFCFPPTDKKTDAEFRKQCCEWLRRISDECGNNFPPVVASLFLSPGGPKFIHLMFHFAQYVIMHHVKADSSGTGMHYPEAVKLRPPDVNMAAAKYRVVHNRFLKNLQKEDLIIQELQKKAQFFSKQIRDLRYENADLDKCLQKMKKNVDQRQNNTAEGTEKIRCIWSLIMETLKFLQKEREVVDSVIKGHVDQYALDGTSVAISVPRPLLEKVEKEMHKMHLGNVYEAGKLNILTVIQLLNTALEMLMCECRLVDKNALKLDLQHVKGKTKFQNKTVSELKLLREKLRHEDSASINQSIAEKQREWDLKWENCLGQSPFHLIKYPNPVLDLLPAMSPLSFTPATEEAYKSSVFYQYPASIPDSTKKNFQTNGLDRSDKALGTQGRSTVVTSERTDTASHPTTESANAIQIPFEKGSNTETPKRIQHSNSQILKYKGRNPRPTEAWNKKQISVVRTPSSVKREDPLKRAREQLAEEVADVVAADLPQHSGGKEKELESLIDTLISDPFTTRKQIPRTPENRESACSFTETRSSWNKQTAPEESSSVKLHHSETKDRPQYTAPALKNQIDSSMACFMSSCMSDKSPFLEWKSPFKYQQVATSPSELFTQQAAVEPLNNMYCKEGLMCIAPNKSVTENPELVSKTVNKSVSELDFEPGEGIAIESLATCLGQNSSMCTTLSWDASRMVSGISSDSHEIIQLGILQENLDGERESINFNSSNVNVNQANTEENNSRDCKTFSDSVVGSEHKLDFQSIQRRYEALKRTVLENKDSLSSRKQIPRCRSEFSLTPVNLETKDVLSFLGKPYASDAELVKTPSRITLLEREVDLSALGAFSPVQPR